MNLPAEKVIAGLMTGSGMEQMFPEAERLSIRTEYGSVSVYLSQVRGNFFAIIPRHGRDHSVPPHAINFRANVRAMEKLGVRDVIATSAVGSLSTKLKVGGLGLVDQFVDWSKRRLTFFEDEPVHVDMTHPYDAGIQQRIRRAARSLGQRLVPGLVYFCVDGPRYETAAEVALFARLGGDVVGMTGAPEAILTREAGIRYASIVISTNWGAGIQEKVSHDEVVAMMEETRPRVRALLERTIGDWSR